MIRFGRAPCGGTAFLVAAAWLGFSAALPAQPSVLPYSIVVKVAWSEPVGPESFRAGLEGELSTRLALARCFRSIRTSGPVTPASDDLEFRIVISAFREEADYEQRLADLAAPGAAGARPAVASLEAVFELEARLLDGATVRRRLARIESSWRPLASEDPREQAFHQLIDKAARSAQKFACKGSAEQWAREIARARAATPR